MLCPDALPTLVAGLAAAIANNRCDEDIAMISAFLVQLGDSLALILAARACQQPVNCPEPHSDTTEGTKNSPSEKSTSDAE